MMELQTFLKANVEELGIETCAKKAGYKVVSNGVKHIKSLLDEPFCGVIGSRSEQDWAYTDTTLLQTLFDLFKCPEELVDKNRYAAECVLKDREAAQYRHIKAVVEKKNVHSWGQALQYENLTTINKLLHLNAYDFKHQLTEVSRILKAHHVNYKDEFGLYGKVLLYRYHYAKDKEPIEFDVNGNVVKTCSSSQI